MKAIIQRVSQAKVEVNSNTVGKINSGIVVFIGFTHTDNEEYIKWFANKLIHLRIFEDENGKINHSLIEKKGSILLISQFSVYGDCMEGRRPSFTKAASPEKAKILYEKMINELRQEDIPLETGIFGAKMEVSLVNDGPLTFIIER